MLQGMATLSWAQRLGRVRSDLLVRGFGAYGLAELCIRVTRIVTAIVLARWLDAVELGVAATAIATYEMIGFLASRGLGQTVVRAAPEHLAATCITARRLSFALATSVGCAILLAGLVIWLETDRGDLFAMIACLALTLAFLPFGLTQSWLLEREFKAGTLSRIHVLQVGSDNLGVAILAILGFGAWSIVLPRLVSTPIWLIAVRRSKSWSPDRSVAPAPVRGLLNTAAPILVSEFFIALRFNVDKLIVGWLLGMQALGVYYFAFSAGYGLSMVLTSALAASSFPYIAQANLSVREMVERFDTAVRRLGAPISALILCQASAVFIYVPILFGEKWAAETTVVAILCVSAATKCWLDLSSLLLRASGLVRAEMIASAIYTVVFLLVVAIGFQWGLLTGAVVLTVSTIVLQLAFAVWARRHVAAHARCVTSTVEPAGR